VSIAIIDYGSGNLHSAQKAVERASVDAGVGGSVFVTSDPDLVARADRIVLPGVGAFADCRRGLENRAGMIEALTEAVIHKGRPFLGICVGMQLMAERGLEHEVARGLGWIAGDVVAIEPKTPDLRIPHMGWNTLRVRREHPILKGIATGDQGLHAYFVHSFHMKPKDPASIIADTDYGEPVTAIVGRDNIVGSQFHPEKSQKLGLAFIANFLRWRP
jgi:glutamine amidotransferase